MRSNESGPKAREQYSSRMSSTRVICENTNTRCPPARSFSSSLCSNESLPEASTCRRPVRAPSARGVTHRCLETISRKCQRFGKSEIGCDWGTPSWRLGVDGCIAYTHVNGQYLWWLLRRSVQLPHGNAMSVLSWLDPCQSQGSTKQKMRAPEHQSSSSLCGICENV